MGKPIPYDDTVVAAMHITNGVVDIMKAHTGISAVERGYWTEWNRLYDATTNADPELINHCLMSLVKFFTKMNH